MAAFKGFDPFSRDLPGVDPFVKNDKYKDYNPQPLMALDPRNAPANPAASQGALQAPPSGGAPIPAFSPGDEGMGVGEARKPKQGKDFFSIWDKGDTKDRERVARNMQDVFAQKGLSLEGATKMMFDQGGEVAARIGEKYGLVPPADKAGMPAFKTREQAVLDMENKRAATKNKNEKRRAMGGFLMEMGLHILASNRDDAAGAIGEGALATMDARRKRATESEDRSIAKKELERQRHRQDEADARAKREEARAVEKEKRDVEKWNIDKKRLQQDADSGNLVKIVDKEGVVRFVPKKAGPVYDEDGKFVRQATADDISAAQRHTDIRAYNNAVDQAYNKIKALAEKSKRKLVSMYPSLEGLEGDEFRAEAQRIAREEVSASDPRGDSSDPLGLGL